jgi:hypothetical protein
MFLVWFVERNELLIFVSELFIWRSLTAIENGFLKEGTSGRFSSSRSPSEKMTIGSRCVPDPRF